MHGLLFTVIGIGLGLLVGWVGDTRSLAAVGALGWLGGIAAGEIILRTHTPPPATYTSVLGAVFFSMLLAFLGTRVLPRQTSSPPSSSPSRSA